MNSMSKSEFTEMHQHQRQCEQKCFVFTDIELTPEIIKFSGSDKLKNGNIAVYRSSNNSSHKKEVSYNETLMENPAQPRYKKILLGIGLVFICIAMAGGIPLALQLRSSSLLEARLSFIRRLLSESPLIEGSWKPIFNVNLTKSVTEVRNNHIGVVFWPIRVACGAQYLDAVQLALEGVDEAKLITANNRMHIAESADEMQQAHLKGKIAVLMGIEGGHAIGASLAVLRSMYLLGARFVSLTSLDCSTPWAVAAVRSGEYVVFEKNSTNLINNFGKTVIYEMNRLGMLVEVSQLSEHAIGYVFKISKAPVLLMNSIPRSLCNSTSVTSLSDHIISLLPENGGVILLNLERCADSLLSIRQAINAINYVRKVAGIDHIGLGGAPKSYTLLLAELARDRVWGNVAIKKLIGGNVVRLLREVEALKNRLPLYENWIPHKLIERNSYCRYSES